MDRSTAIQLLYQQLTTFVRRSRDLGTELHPGLSVVEYTFLTHIAASKEVRAADLADHFGLDKSTVSRQVDGLLAAGLLTREGPRQGRRGQLLALTAAGHEQLDLAAARVQAQLADWLTGWGSKEIAAFAKTMARFNAEVG